MWYRGPLTACRLVVHSLWQPRASRHSGVARLSRALDFLGAFISQAPSAEPAGRAATRRRKTGAGSDSGRVRRPAAMGAGRVQGSRPARVQRPLRALWPLLFTAALASFCTMAEAAVLGRIFDDSSCSASAACSFSGAEILPPQQQPPRRPPLPRKRRHTPAAQPASEVPAPQAAGPTLAYP